ncbi:MAG: sialate O-acetylesterase [Planctomycetes bacterium]|nr:sialate O-acetylesterase [Planctomycetota bacterium]MBL7040212.1 sialate O-acetylesterase [Pirellulaceae bacterium]
MKRWFGLKLSLAWCLVALASTTSADVRLPAIVDDNMILQQEMGAPIWGWADPGEMVTVAGSWGRRVSVTADDKGKWKVCLNTPSHGGPYTLTIKGKNEISIDNVLIGEVWLCAGQSNMGWRLQFTFEGAEDSAAANYPDFRIFRSERCHSHVPQEDCIAEWTPCTPETAATCSAVSFYFARKLHQELGIPIGIVLQPYAGTPIEGWMPKEIQMDDPRTRAVVEEMDADSAAYDPAVAKEQLERARQRWKQGLRRGEPKLRTPSNMGHQYPGNIFNGMIYPVRPYGIRGAIWYQGERNAKHVAQAANYVNQLPLLIDYYRSSWHKLSEGNVAKDFPFYFVQLPSWMAPQAEPVEADAAWAVSREMMRMVARSVPNTGVAVSIDTGDEILLHPLDKKPIGLRLAYLALKKTYGRDFVEYGPFYKSHHVRGNKIVLKFDSVGSGLAAGKDGPLDSFATAGKDRAFVWADAVIEDDSVVVSAKDIAAPVAVRYAWAMNPSHRNLLYNKEGIPASPFRTDDWPLIDARNYIPREQVKPEKPADYSPIPLKRPPMTK